MVVENEFLKEQLEETAPIDQKTGTAFYKYLFLEFPQLKVHFKGREDTDPSTIPNDPFFQKQGEALIRRLHALVNAADDDAKFRAIVKPMVIKHHQSYGVDASVFHELPAILGGFLMSQGVEPIPEWTDFCAYFTEVADQIAATGYA